MDEPASRARGKARILPVLLVAPLLLGIWHIPPACGASFVRGDANADGKINITDAIFVLNFLFLGGATPRCLDAADADDKSERAVNITDAIYLLNFLFLGGPSPPTTSRSSPRGPTSSSWTATRAPTSS